MPNCNYIPDMNIQALCVNFEKLFYLYTFVNTYTNDKVTMFSGATKISFLPTFVKKNNSFSIGNYQYVNQRDVFACRRPKNVKIRVCFESHAPL